MSENIPRRRALLTPILCRNASGLATGCLLTIIGAVVIMIGAAVYIAMNAKHWAAEVVVAAMTLVIDESGIPDDEKGEILVIVDQLKQDFKDGLISWTDLQRIMAASIEENPVLALAAVYQFETSYLMPSALRPAEIKAAHLVLNRLMQGLLNGKIESHQLKMLSESLRTVDADGDQTFRESTDVHPDEIRQIVAEAKTLADAAGIPETEVYIDISEEFRIVVENALGHTI